MVKKQYVAISGIVVLLVSVVLLVHFRNAEEEAIVDLFQTELQPVSLQTEPPLLDQETIIMVDIKGAVTRPGVYELKHGDRVYHAIDLAGGVLNEADEHRLNLAQLIQDEMVIYVPLQGEEVLNFQSTTGTTSQDGKVAINRVDALALEQLPGIGPAKAAAIINYRDEHGPFTDINDLLNVSGIGPKSIGILEELMIFH
ncbi:helix-hairpin-helix domain-containing protein [Halalkalibacter alkalisediminis]|uniref:Helix-hairpin-helix domain-containing protein n=1 Tax=Halalkalibacter alkalisediminis TaxID=935616 RepID=A0ABV6NB80_9BACI|nr:helix-hairpin-helix domain-containing protein [Halalkalibacter alkalisediminis]